MKKIGLVIGLLVLALLASTATLAGPPDHKILICHVPPGNPENAHNIWVDRHAWENGHSPHNKHALDYEGPCREAPPTPIPIPETPTPTPVPPTPTPIPPTPTPPPEKTPSPPPTETPSVFEVEELPVTGGFPGESNLLEKIGVGVILLVILAGARVMRKRH